MVNNINSELLSTVLNGSLSNQGVSGVKNALSGYESNKDVSDSGLIDQGNISEEALAKYQAEQEVAYYTQMLNAMLKQDDSNSSNSISGLMSLVQSGNYNIDDSTLAEAISNDDYAQTLLDSLKIEDDTNTQAASSEVSQEDTIMQLLSETLGNIQE